MNDISRRKFIQLTVLGSAVAAAGCDLKNHSEYDSRIYKAEASGQYGGYDNRVLPYVNQPDGYQDGVPQYFATACAMCPAGCGLFVRTMGGRAHNVQGNPGHPVSGGKVCARGIASLQNVYNVDRLRFPAIRSGKNAAPTRSDWETVLTRTAQAIKSNRGKLAILTDAVTINSQPTLSRLVSDFAQKAGGKTFSYSLIDNAPWIAASQTVYGKSQLPAYRLDEADFILAFGSDFLEAGPSQVYYNRLFGEFRQGPRRKQGEHGTFIYIGPRMNATAAKADKWIPCEPGTEGLIAQSLLRVINHTDVSYQQPSQVNGEGYTSYTSPLYALEGFIDAGNRAVAIGGGDILTQPDAVQSMTAIEQLNAQAQSICVGFGESALPITAPNASYLSQMQSLITDMQSGRIGALLILGQTNPAYALPASMNFAQAITKVPFVASITPFEDETTAHADVLLPARAALEDWGDDIPAVLPPGVRMATLRQPVIDPQFITDSPGLSPENFTHDLIPWMDTRSTGDLLIDLARRIGKPLSPTDMRDAVRRTWATIGQADLNASGTNNDPAWLNALAQGGLWKQNAIVPAIGTVPPAIRPAPLLPPTPKPPANTYALHLFTHPYFWDGRHANLPWMQEIASPMSMAVWNAWVEINMEVAHNLNIRTGDIVRLATSTGFIDAPALPSPALHPGIVAMPIGQGHTSYGTHATGRGSNPLSLLGVNKSTRVTLTKIKSALSGYNGPETLVLPQDRPNGAEPDAVQDLIHTSAKEWKKAKPVKGAPQAEGSIFSRKGGPQSPGEPNPGE